MKMLKMFVATAVVMLSAWSLANAKDGPQVGTMRGGPQALATADYGGYYVSTGAFTSDAVTACIKSASFAGSGVVTDVVFSTGHFFNVDFVEVFDSTSTDLATASTRIGRFYNTGGGNYNVTGSTIISGPTGLRQPIRFSKGLIWKASASVYNLITVLFYQEGGLD